MSEFENGYQPEEAEQTEVFDLEHLIANLDVQETEEMTHTRALLVDAVRSENKDEQASLYNDYCEQLESMIRDHHSNAEAQLAGDLLVSTIFNEAGDTGRYLEELENSLVYAEGIGQIDIAAKLRNEIEAFQ